MSDFIMRPEDEHTHRAGPEVNFNESVYTICGTASSGQGYD
jgi:hypothetical protein